MGNTRVGDPVPITLDDTGRIYLLVISAGEDASRLRVVALDSRADVVWDRTFEEIALTRPEKPRILWDGKALQLFWLSDQGLYHARLEGTGRLLDPPVLLSGGTTVGHYDVAGNASGALAVWYAGTREEPGLYVLPPGDPRGAATLVDAEGIRPSLQYDDAETLHVVWGRYPAGSGDKPFFYATYPHGVYAPGQERVAVVPRVVGTTVLEGPELGLDEQYAYVFWSMTYYSGLEAGSTEAQYVYFPREQPELVSSTRLLSVPYSYNLDYQAVQVGDLKAGERVPLEPTFEGGVHYITQMTANSVPGQKELVIAFHTRMGYLMRKTQSQVSAVFFQDGVPTSYQLLSFTPASSTSPAIFSAEPGWLYLTWLEKGELPGWAVYFASSAPDIREALSPLSSDDVGRLTVEALFGLVIGALLVPVALIWVLPTMIVLGLTSGMRSTEEHLTSRGVLASLALGLVVLWVGKLAVLPGILGYVPLSAWLPVIPSWLGSLLQAGVPLLITGVALLVAWNYTYGKGEGSVFPFMVIYAIGDGILTMAVYGVLIYAAF